MRLTSFLVIALALSSSLAARSGEARQGETLEGTWLPAAAELAGQMLPDEVRKSIKLVVRGDRYTVTAGEQVDQGKLKLNAGAKPKEVDITGTEGPNKGKTF